MSLIYTLGSWLKFLIIAAVVCALGWWAITHAEQVAHFVLTIVGGVVTFVKTVFFGLQQLIA